MESGLEQILSRIERNGRTPVTQQLYDAFAAAIASGELPPGAKLPSTRRLAELVHINPLTATRCYRKLAESGLVVSAVGRGTFVRAGAATASAASDPAWQTYALPPRREGSDGLLAAPFADPEAPRLISLSAGYPGAELVPRVELRRAAEASLDASGNASFGYCPVEGDTALREQLAELGRSRGLDDEPDSIVVTTGARQALTLAIRAVVRPGDVVACESPTFVGILQSLRAVGANVMPVGVDADGLRVEELEQLLRAHEVHMVVLQPRGQNPTGQDLSNARRERLLELSSRHGVFVLEDAVYADLRFEGRDPGVLRSHDPAHVIYVDSLSKTVAPGLRIGWVAASGPVLDRIIVEKRDDDAQSATLPQNVAARFLADGGYTEQIVRAREFYAARRKAMVSALDREMSGMCTFLAPRAGAHLWLHLDQPHDDALLYRAALTAGVSYQPGPTLLVEPPHTTQLRLSFAAVSPDAIGEGVARLASVLRALPRRADRHTLPLA